MKNLKDILKAKSDTDLVNMLGDLMNEKDIAELMLIENFASKKVQIFVYLDNIED